MYKVGEIIVNPKNSFKRKIARVIEGYGKNSNYFGYSYFDIIEGIRREYLRPTMCGENTMYKWQKGK